LVIVAPGYFELDSVVQIGKTIHEVKEYFNPNLTLLGFLFTMSDPTINSRTSLKILRQTYTDEVLKTVIPRNTDIRDAHFNKQDIFGYNPEAKAAQLLAVFLIDPGSSGWGEPEFFGSHLGNDLFDPVQVHPVNGFCTRALGQHTLIFGEFGVSRQI
jgi:hypothetical protein